MNVISQLEPDRESRAGLRLSAALARLAVAVAAASAVYAPVISAQEPAVISGELEEIVVTARRREENLQDVPIAVTALSGEFLREQKIGELADLAVHVPSFNVSVGGSGTNQPVLSLRGLRPAEVLITIDAAVPLYFAEIVETPTYGTNLAVYDLANVQVLRGPQGTLFGRNSTAGALLFTPNRPGEEFGGYAQGEFGDYGLYGFEGAVDLPVNESLQFRLSGRSLKRDGYQSNVADNALGGDDKFWDEDSVGLRIGMNLSLGERFRSLTTLSYDENNMLARMPTPLVFNPYVTLGAIVTARFNSHGAVDQALARQEARDDWQKIETDMRATENVENWFAANTSEYDLSDELTLKNVFGYRELNLANSNDTDGTALGMFGSIEDVSTLPYTVTRHPEDGTIDTRQYSDELQLLGKAFDERLEWIVGGFWYKMKGAQYSPLQVIGPDPVTGKGALTWDVPHGTVDNEAWAAFGESTYHFNEQLALTVGVRGSWDQREITVENHVGGVCSVKDADGKPLPNDACARTEDHGFAKPTWRTILTWTPRDGMMMYGSVATGYRTGGYNMRGADNASLQPFDEETVTTYELGGKADWQLGEVAAMRTNLAIYTQDFEDIQNTRSTGAGGFFASETVNAAKAQINGLELDVTIAPSDNLSVSLAYSYVDASYDEWFVRNFEDPSKFDDQSNNEFAWVPENSLTGSVKYTLPLDPSVGEISAMASVYWQDEVVADPAWVQWQSYVGPKGPTNPNGLGWSQAIVDHLEKVNAIDDYAVWNFRLDWRGVMGSAFDVAAYVKNATDEQYATGGLDVAQSLGWVAHVYGPPRTYGASLQWNF